MLEKSLRRQCREVDEGLQLEVGHWNKELWLELSYEIFRRCEQPWGLNMGGERNEG